MTVTERLIRRYGYECAAVIINRRWKRSGERLAQSMVEAGEALKRAAEATHALGLALRR